MVPHDLSQLCFLFCFRILSQDSLLLTLQSTTNNNNKEMKRGCIVVCFFKMRSIQQSIKYKISFSPFCFILCSKENSFYCIVSHF